MMDKRVVLFVEDNDVNYDSFETSVNDWNALNEKHSKTLVPVRAKNYLDAIDCFRMYRLDCALIDLRLPEGDSGRESADNGNRLAREALYTFGVPLAIISGHTAEFDPSLADPVLICLIEKGDHDAYERALGWLSVFGK